jgi:hypothetical protein
MAINRQKKKHCPPPMGLTHGNAWAKWTIYLPRWLPIRSYLVGIKRGSTSYKMGYHDETRY